MLEEKIVDVIEVDKPNTQLVCHITPRKLSLGDAEESWILDRADMMTHLTALFDNCCYGAGNYYCWRHTGRKLFCRRN